MTTEPISGLRVVANCAQIGSIGKMAVANFRLDGEVAIITGGGGGIGKATARAFVEAGARVIILDANKDAAQMVANEFGNLAEARHLDVSDENSVERCFSEILQRYGRLDILFNNAGISHMGSTVDLPLSAWERELSVNMTGMFLCARAAARHMVGAKSGRIVNTASILGFSGRSFVSVAYQATKGAVINMTRSWAVEWAPAGIRVNAVAPGLVKTSMTAELPAPLTQQLITSTPLGRFAEPDEIAAPVLFLVSPAASMITGHILVVDGGLLMR